MSSPRATPSTDGRTAWFHLLQVSRLVLRELDDRLGREHRLGVNEFDVLITLDNSPERRLRMTDLARAVMLSSGGWRTAAWSSAYRTRRTGAASRRR